MMTDKEVRNEVIKRAKLLDEKSKRQKKIVSFGVSSILCAAVILVTVISVPNFYNHHLITPGETEFLGKNESEQTPSVSNGEQSENPPGRQSSTVDNKPPKDEPINNQTTLKLFVPSPLDPDYDSFGEDGLAHVDIVLNGSIIYKQILLADYPKYGLSTDLKKSDFGEYVGTVVETGTGKNGNVKVGADDPALSGSKVYYYTPVGCQAAVIVQNQTYCSIFVFSGFADQNRNHSFTEQYSLFNASSANDIAFLSFTVTDETDKQSGPFKVTDRDKINTFYQLTSSFVPFEIVNPKAPTPDWLNKAMEEYNNLPEGSKREYISIEVHFKNGLILKDITYQPYLATGYVEGMEALTPEQNNALRAALSAD